MEMKLVRGPAGVFWGLPGFLPVPQFLSGPMVSLDQLVGHLPLTAKQPIRCNVETVRKSKPPTCTRRQKVSGRICLFVPCKAYHTNNASLRGQESKLQHYTVLFGKDLAA